MQSKKKIVLAYSGGLDTSIILKWLQENKLDQECKYDYEAADKKIATSAIFVMIKKAEELIK